MAAPAPPVPPPPTGPDPTAKAKATPVFAAVINELNVNQDQLQKRQRLLTEIEGLLTARYGAANRLVAYVLRFGHTRTSMGSADIPALETILNSISGAEQLNLLLHSPGGDPMIIEKIVDMCRSHLSGNNKKFRVIVPNVAKSAATVLALGSDKILMGYCSEIGPIDPQVQIAVSGVTHWVSAWSFVEARDSLMDEIDEATKKKQPLAGFLQQLAGLNIPFTKEMENWVYFAGKTAETLLYKYMLVARFPNARIRRRKAQQIAQKLLSKALFPVHGQFIDGPTAQKLDLEVELLGRDEDLWLKLWEYYIRAEVQMNVQVQPGQIKTRLFESSGASMVGQDSAS